MSRGFLLAIFLSGCMKPYEFKALPQGPIKHQLIALAQIDDTVQAKGFAGSVPPKTIIDFTLGSQHKRCYPKADGSFSLVMPKDEAQTAGFTFTIGQEQYSESYSIKDLDHALAQVAKPALAIKGQIDDFLIAGTHALFLSSAAAELNQMKLKDTWSIAGKAAISRALNPDAKQALYPRSFAVAGGHALFTLSGTHELLLLSLKDGRLLTKTRLRDERGSLFLFTLNPPLTVKDPLSADQSSQPSSSISRSFAHTPDQVLALNAQTLIVSFSNYYQYYDPRAHTEPVLGPAILAMLSIDGEAIITKSIIMLPFKNPVFIHKVSNDQLWVTCAGVYDFKGSRLRSTLAGLAKLEAKDNLLSLKYQIALNDFVPAQPAFVKDSIILPEAFGSRLAVFKEENTWNDFAFKTPERAEYRFTGATHWHSDVVFLSEESGSLIAFSLSEGFFPFPFIKPIVLDPKQRSPIAFNPTKVIFRHHERGHGLDQAYSPGFSALVLSSSQSRIVPLDLMGVFGP